MSTQSERKEPQDNTTHFGYRDVPVGDKAKLVGKVFDEVASRYDVMNDLMSFGLHRLWKYLTIEFSAAKTGQTVLDLAGGTGDLSKKLARRVGPTGKVMVADINHSMLSVGRDRLLNQGMLGNLHYVQADAQALPFPENSFACITMAFGLRNVTDKAAALHSMSGCLAPGGQCLVLEFSHPVVPGLQTIYDAYSFNIIPKMGQLITGSSDNYQYLVESIRKHPNQDELKQMMLDSGFDAVKVHNFAGGIVALHRGFKY